MSGLFVNKVAGALLASALGFILINKFSDVVMKPDVPKPEKFAYSLAVETTTDHVEVLEIAFPSPTWLSARDASKGATVFKKCKSCHTVEAGGKDGTGPALWNIVGRPMAGTAGFSYSEGMKAMGGAWGYEELDKFLTKPKDYVTKTKMSFNGIKKEQDRAALIEYLRLASDTPAAQLVAVIAPTVEAVYAGSDLAEGTTTEEVVEMVDGMTEDLAGKPILKTVEEIAKEKAAEIVPPKPEH